MKLSMSAVSFLPQLDSKMVFSLELMGTFSLWFLFKQLSYMLFVIIFIHVLVAPYLSIGRSTVYGVNPNLKNIRRNKLRHKLKCNIFVNLNPFLVSISILYPQKTPENLCFSSVFRGYKMGVLTRNGLMCLS